jgi:hypothetical protein
MRRAESCLKGVNRSSTTLVFMSSDGLNFGAISEVLRFREVGRAPTRARFQTEHGVPRRNGQVRSDREWWSGRADVRGHPVAGRGIG